MPPTMPPLDILLPAVVLPALASGLLLVAAWRPWRREHAGAGGTWGGAVGLGASILLSHGLMQGGWPGIVPPDQWQWLLHLVPVAMAVGILDASRRWPEALRWTVHLSLGALTGWLLVGPWLGGFWLWRIALGLNVVVLIRGLDAPLRRGGGPSLPLCLCVASGGGSLLLVMSFNSRLALLGAALAACLAVAAALAWWRPAVSLGGGITVLAVALPGLLYSGCFETFSEIPRWTYVLVALGPLGIWVGELPPLKGRQRAVARVVAVAVITAVAVAVAVRTAGGSLQ